MKIHYIYYHPIKDELKIIKEGNSYLPLIFTTLWAAYNKIWGILFLCLSFTLLGFFFEKNHILGGQQIEVISLFLKAMCFVFAEDLIEMNLKNEGFVLQTMFLASSSPEAELKYYQLKNNSNV